MKFAVAIFITFLAGCANKGVNTTLFLREDTSHLTNMKGEECSESGYQVDKDRSQDDETKYHLTVFFTNCDVHKIRKLEEFEVKQWADPAGVKK